MSPKRFYFLMIAALVLAIGISTAAFYWGDKKLAAQSVDLSKRLAERDALQAKLDDINQATATVADQESVETLVAAVLPSEKNQQNLIANIINTATAEAGIPASKISSITFTGSGQPDELSGATKSEEAPGVYYYPFTVVVRDIAYDTLIKLFAELEKNKRIIQADQVQISPNKATPGMLSSVTLSLKTYIKP